MSKDWLSPYLIKVLRTEHVAAEGREDAAGDHDAMMRALGLLLWQTPV